MKTLKLTTEQMEAAVAEKMEELRIEALKVHYYKRFEKVQKDMEKDGLELFNAHICITSI